MADAKGAYIGGVPVQFKDAAARAMISDEYNSAETYAKGNLCIYNGKIYEAIKETTGTWDATAWEETTLAKVNSKLNGDITELEEKVMQKQIILEYQTYKSGSVEKGGVSEIPFSFKMKPGYTRNYYISQVAGTGSNTATVNLHAGSISFYAPYTALDMSAVVACMYTKD